MRQNNSAHFVIAVTGHRDLRGTDEPEIRTEVRDVLIQLTNASRPLAPLLISGLAEGADSLVAQEALALGIKVEAVLPMPVEYFQADFQGEARDALFRLLENRDIRVCDLPLSSEPDENGQLPPSVRNRQYALLKEHIHRRADVLVALWDGIENGLTGGTGDVVTGFLSAREASEAAMEVGQEGRTLSAKSRLVVWILVSRRQAAERHGRGTESPIFLVSDGSRNAYWRQTEIPEAFRARWRQIAATAAKR